MNMNWKYFNIEKKLQGQCVEKRLPFIAFYHESIQKAIKFLLLKRSWDTFEIQ